MIIDLPRFLEKERPAWTELEALLNRIQRELHYKLSLEEARRLHYLYQRAASDLNRIATFAAEPELRAYLGGLVARAYGEIHDTPSKNRSWRAFDWFFGRFPAVFRKQIRAFQFSVAATLLGALFGGFAVGLDDHAKAALLPGMFSHLLGNPADRVAEEESRTDDPLKGEHSTFAAALMTHNIRVCITAMGLGITYGLGSLLILFYNGVSIGLIAVDYIRAGQTVFLLGWLLPHGVIEIPATLIAGQAGFVLAGALIGWGDRKNAAERLREAAPDIATLIGGTAILLVWAGIVESYFSQHHQPVLPYSVKIAFGTAELVGLVWLLLNKRQSEPGGQPREKLS